MGGEDGTGLGGVCDFRYLNSRFYGAKALRSEIRNLPMGGIVLCGGESRRMGTPKAWLPFGGEWMLQRVVRVLGEVVHPLVVVAAPAQEVPPLPPAVALVRDESAGKGPLQGLATGFSALSGQVEAAYVSSCDVPLLRPAFVRHLIGLLGEWEAVVPQEGGLAHSLSAVYRVSVLSRVQGLLGQGRLRLSLLPDQCRARRVPVEDLRCVDPDLRSLRNVNSPEDYEAALQEVNGELEG